MPPPVPTLHFRQPPPPPTYHHPSTTLTLPTIFTPPATCASAPLTLLPNSLLWLNAPVVALPGSEGESKTTTFPACYPPQYLSHYTLIPATTTTTASTASTASPLPPSSIAPAFKPLVCPRNYCTAYVGARDNYIACCPAGYAFSSADTTAGAVVKERPAYGGVCYSTISGSEGGRNVEVVVYDGVQQQGREGATVVTVTVTVSVSASGVRAYANPIDGWAGSSARSGCAREASTALWASRSSVVGGKGSGGSGHGSGAGHGSSVKSKGGKKGRKAGGGVIAGAVIGGLSVLGAVVGMVMVLLKKKEGEGEGEEEQKGLMGAQDGEVAGVADREAAGAPSGEVAGVSNGEANGGGSAGAVTSEQGLLSDGGAREGGADHPPAYEERR